MKIYYFPNPSNKYKLCSIISDKPESVVRVEHRIPKSDKCVSIPYTLDSKDLNYLVCLQKIEYLKFDNLENPTCVVYDTEYAIVEKLKQIRQLRLEKLNELDKLQIRAMAKSNTSLISEIESDKDKLRNLPKDIDLSKYKDLYTIELLFPAEIIIDYNEKYKNRL